MFVIGGWHRRPANPLHRQSVKFLPKCFLRSSTSCEASRIWQCVYHTSKALFVFAQICFNSSREMSAAYKKFLLYKHCVIVRKTCARGTETHTLAKNNALTKTRNKEGIWGFQIEMGNTLIENN